MKTAHHRPLVVIDARMIGPVGHGIAEYVRDLVLGLSEIPDKKYDFHLLISKKMLADDPLRKLQHTEVGSPFLSPKEMIEVPKVLKGLRADLFHSPSFAAFPFNSLPTIYTVHDLIHLQFGSLFHKAYYQWILKPALRRAAKVCTVSEFSRNEIAQWLGWPKENISVVRNAIHVEEPPPDWEERLRKRGLVKHKYHFSLSSSKPHKNMPFLIQAYLAHAEKNRAAWPLVVSLSPEEVGFKHPKVICVDRLDSKDKTSLLAGAGAFYFPSLIEGFGRPPLEAAAFGVPVVVSDIPVHREVLEEVIIKDFLSPQEIVSWTTKFKEIENEVQKPLQSEYQVSRVSMGFEMNEIYIRCMM